MDIEIGSSILLAYGPILRNFINLKENIFGEDESFTDMGTSNKNSSNTAGGGMSSSSHLHHHHLPTKFAPHLTPKEDATKSISEISANPDDKPKPFDPRQYRPLDVIVSLTIHDIQAHLVKNCNDTDPPCPVVLIERLGFEMKKRFFETELQILVSPSFLISSDNVVRPSRDKHLKQGHLLLSAVQVRGHAMFSNEGRTLDEETLEYGWLLEIQLGKLSGKMTIPQLCHVVTSLETFLMLTVDTENELRPPKTLRYCHHGVPSNLCSHTKDEIKYRCPSSEDIKYRMTRVAIDAIDLYFIESGTALHTWISPIRVSTCNLHGQKVKSGITGLVSTILVRHFVSTSGHFYNINGGGAINSYSNTNTTGSGRSGKIHSSSNSKATIDEKKEDLNVLFKRDDPNAIKYKKESDYKSYRRESRDNDTHSIRRSRDSEFHHKKDKDDLYASVHSSSNRERNRDVDADPWLEVGCVSMGPIIMESASSLPIPEHCLHLVQHNFLKVHDKRQKRLWFMWSNAPEGSRCGCTGGSVFFGNNINGPKFFKPSAQDVQDGINIARYQIHTNTKEYGFGQSLLHEGQLVFHTPPYSLQPVSLQECHESFGKANIRIARPDVGDQKSPLVQHKSESSGVAAAVEKPYPKIKTKDIGSPATLERKNRRFSYGNSTRPTAHEVPYARLLDSPSRIGNAGGKGGKDQIDPKISPTPLVARPQQPLPQDATTPKSLRIPTPKTSSSDSKLTVEYNCTENSEPVPDEMSHSAPQPNPLESDSDPSLSPKMISEDEIVREVNYYISCRGILLSFK